MMSSNAAFLKTILVFVTLNQLIGFVVNADAEELTDDDYNKGLIKALGELKTYADIKKSIDVVAACEKSINEIANGAHADIMTRDANTKYQMCGGDGTKLVETFLKDEMCKNLPANSQCRVSSANKENRKKPFTNLKTFLTNLNENVKPAAGAGGADGKKTTDETKEKTSATTKAILGISIVNLISLIVITVLIVVKHYCGSD